MYFPCLSVYFLVFVCTVITWWAGPSATVYTGRITILLQCFGTAGWVILPVKASSPNDLYCVEWDAKRFTIPYLMPFFRFNSEEVLKEVILDNFLITVWTF